MASQGELNSTYYPEGLEYNDHYEAAILSDSDDDDDVEDVASVHSASTMNSQKKKQRKLLDKFHEQTRGFVVLKNAKKRKNRIEGYYTSTIPGAPIRNAVTGYHETDFIGTIKFSYGSPWEDLFFKVIDNTTVGGTYTFFYDTPEQYERHRNFKLNPEITKKWYIRHEHLKKLLRIQEDEYNARKSVQVK